MIDFLEKKDLGEIMKIAKQEPDIKKAVKEMLELPVGRAFDIFARYEEKELRE